MKPHRNELALIENLRFLAAMTVVIFHYQIFFHAGIYDENVALELRTRMPLYGALWPVFTYGYYAVPAFWAISGYIFFWHYAKPINSGEVGLFDFAIRRFSRLYPLHLITLAIVIVEQHFYKAGHNGASFIYPSDGIVNLLHQISFSAYWFVWQKFAFNGPIWSVSVEILIYGFFFFLAKAIRLNVFIAILLAIFFQRMQGHTWIFHGDVALCGFYFFVGGAIERSVKLPNIGAKFATLGNATYSSYLIHFPMIAAIVLVTDALGLSRDIFFSPIIFVLFISAVAAASLPIYHWIEIPAQNSIRRFCNSFILIKSE